MDYLSSFIPATSISPPSFCFLFFFKFILHFFFIIYFIYAHTTYIGLLTSSNTFLV